MGNILTLTNLENIDEEVKFMIEENELMRSKLEMMSERIGRLERDIINTRVDVNSSREDIKTLSNRLLAIDLLEEGRSNYINKRRVSHTASSYR